MDLFESKEFQSKKLSPGFPDAPPSPMVVEPLLDKFVSNDIYKFGTNYSKVKSGNETFIEQEISGIRFKSLVELNNPLIYGNEAVRIVQRSTPLLEDMKSATGGSEAGGGLIGGKINQARDFVNSKLGIPQTQIPSRVTDKIIELSGKKELTSADPITEDIVGANGTGLGKFLKDSGGGNPATIGKQALGNGIGLAKDKLRGALFGDGQTIGEAVGEKIQTNYNDTNKYSKVLKDNRDYKKEGGDAGEFKGIDLSLVSPIYGTQRKETFGKFGRSEYAFERIEDGKSKGTNARINYFEPDLPYFKDANGKESILGKFSLEKKYGLANGFDNINLLGSADYDSIDDFGVISKGEDKFQDLIPFYIGKYGGSKKTIFRSTLTGITENVSPSWNSHKFLGNPFPFYTYSQIERSTSFNLKIYCSSPLELATNWEKMESLTKMAYPSFTAGNLVNPPIIEFRLGDIYYNKVGYIETLTNTIPDNSTWETDGNLGYLPKFIDISITIKFIEDSSVLSGIYGYKKSKAAIEQINKANDAKDFDTDSVGVDRAGEGSTQRAIPQDKAPTINARGVVLTKPPIPTVNLGGLSGLAKPKKLDKKDTTQLPKDIEAGVENPITVQSAMSDSLGGKTPIEAMKDELANTSITPGQAFSKQNFFAKHNNPKVISKKDALSLFDPRTRFGLTDDDLDNFDRPGILCMVGEHKVYKETQVEFHSADGVHSWSGFL